jgi:hypothetical protein
LEKAMESAGNTIAPSSSSRKHDTVLFVQPYRNPVALKREMLNKKA